MESDHKVCSKMPCFEIGYKSIMEVNLAAAPRVFDGSPKGTTAVLAGKKGVAEALCSAYTWRIFV